MDSEFHGHQKTVTLSFISPNLSKLWRFLAFWLNLLFGSFLLFLVCHVTAFLFSCYSILVQHACNDRAWLTSECSPRYDNFGTVRQAIAWYIKVWLTIFNDSRASSVFAKKIKKCYAISSQGTSSAARIAFNIPAIFFLEFLILGMMYTQLAGDVTWRESLLFSHTKLSFRIRVVS